MALIQRLRFFIALRRNMISLTIPRNRGFLVCPQDACLVKAVFLVDGFGYQTALARLGLCGRRDYTDRNFIEKWFQTLKQRIDRFYHSWVGSQRSVRQWIEQFVHYYNHQRPHQSIDNRTPAEEVVN